MTAHSRRPNLACLMIILALTTLPCAAQIKGLKTAKFPADGFSIKVPREWDQIPPQPGEDTTVAKWALDTQKKGSGDTYALTIMKFRPRGGVTGDTTKETPTSDKDKKEFDPKEFMKRYKERTRPVSFEDYWSKTYRSKTPKPEALKIAKRKGQLFLMNGVSEYYGNSVSTIVGTVSDGTFEWAIIYAAPTKELFPEKKPSKSTKVKSKIISSIKSVKFFDRVVKNQVGRVDLDKMSEFDKKIREVKAKLPKSWKVVPTPKKQYVIVHNIPRKKTRQLTFVKNIVKYLEHMRLRYEEIFPPKKEITAVSIVRVCQNREEYNQYGGPGGTAGYFSPSQEELVIYDASASGGYADSYSTLFHEAYHQYLYYAVGEVSAHRWFDEGYGDYFAGADPKRDFKIDVFDWRTGTVKDAVSSGKNVPLKKLFKYTQAQYYTNASICYAQGWALVYFLKSRAAARGNERWPKILEIYFNTLVKTRDRDVALKAALKDVDLDALDDAYKTFIKRGFK